MDMEVKDWTLDMMTQITCLCLFYVLSLNIKRKILNMINVVSMQMHTGMALS